MMKCGFRVGWLCRLEHLRMELSIVFSKMIHVINTRRVRALIHVERERDRERERERGNLAPMTPPYTFRLIDCVLARVLPGLVISERESERERDRERERQRERERERESVCVSVRERERAREQGRESERERERERERARERESERGRGRTLRKLVNRCGTANVGSCLIQLHLSCYVRHGCYDEMSTAKNKITITKTSTNTQIQNKYKT